MGSIRFSRREFLAAGTAVGCGLAAVGSTAARSAIAAQGPGDGPTLRVRKNIADLTPQELESLRRGVAAMKERQANDPTSWSFQANMHGMLGPRTNPLFMRCEHGTMWFLPWHRGYLYFFERILRKASGDDALTLPYWDWTASPAVPSAYRDPADMSNSLFDATRDMNDGSLLPPSVVMDDLAAAMGQFAFSDPGFSSSLEDSPHGQVHVFVGGNMGSVPTAANDPVFWLHHCNVDRTWDRWLSTSDGRGNPGDSTWMSVAYSYADENGQVVQVRVADIFDSAKLGYRYDDVPSPGGTSGGTPHLLAAVPGKGAHGAGEGNGGHGGDATPRGTLAASSIPPAGGPTALAGVPEKPLGFRDETIALNPAPPAAQPLHMAVAAAHANRPGKILLEVRGLNAAATPKFTYDVFLNLPDGETAPERMRLHRVGSINFFGKTAGEHGHEGADAAAGSTQTFDATAVVAHLRELGAWDPQHIRVTLRPSTVVAPRDKEAEVRRRAEASAEAAKIRYRRIDLRLAP